MHRSSNLPTNIEPPQAQTSSNPPALMDLQIAPPPQIEFKELVSQKCSERGIIFAPMPGRRENGKQVRCEFLKTRFNFLVFFNVLFFLLVGVSSG